MNCDWSEAQQDADWKRILDEHNPATAATLREEFFTRMKAVLAADEAELVRELHAQGANIHAVSDLVNTARPYPELYPVLVRHLELPHRRGIRESIVRALTVKDARAVAEAVLLRHFHAETNPNLKWVFANALKTVMPLKERKKHPEIELCFRGNRQ